MYFSVISPSQAHLRSAVRDLAHAPYGQHQWIWKFFREEGDPALRKDRDFIFRAHAAGELPRYYVVSARAPVAFSNDWEVQSRAYEPQPPAGQRLSFVLCANPVVSKKDGQGKSRRHDVVMQAKKDKQAGPQLSTAELVRQTCLAWLQARAAKAGFELVGATVDAYQQQKARKRDGANDIAFSSVEFSGELLVTDPQLFRQTLLHGLGHAKAFGCGLLLVKKVSES
jgi:CRISPR system Cascade subunit CasE